MKKSSTLLHLPLPSWLRFRIGVLTIAVAFNAGPWIQSGQAIPLTGANGRTVEFAGIKSAGPGGLTVQLKPGDAQIEVGWDKFDLNKIGSELPVLTAAYQKAQKGGTTELNLGSFAPKPSPAKEAMPPKPVPKSDNAPEGYFEVRISPEPEENFSGAVLGISIPESDPKAILLISRGVKRDYRSFIFRERGEGPWQEFQTELGFAILSCGFSSEEAPAGGVRTAPSNIEAQNGSGAALLRGLDALSEASGKDLSSLPIAIYGIGPFGAAFAYNFTQWKPERVIATVAAKGAYYSAPPTEESVKVPLLLFWGEYAKGVSGYEETATHAEIYEKHIALKPNWLNAMEFRGPNNETPITFDFGKKFLKKMIELRMAGNELSDLDRSAGWVGDLESFEFVKMEDPEAELTATQTWLPDEDWAKNWKDLADGKYVADKMEKDQAP